MTLLPLHFPPISPPRDGFLLTLGSSEVSGPPCMPPAERVSPVPTPPGQRRGAVEMRYCQLVEV